MGKAVRGAALAAKEKRDEPRGTRRTHPPALSLRQDLSALGVDARAATDARFYFAAPYHSWERGTNENTNGLIRQYLPKRTSMASITQRDCTQIARKLNRRPRKRLGFRTPEECYEK
jgi:hypothetical protein